MPDPTDAHIVDLGKHDEIEAGCLDGDWAAVIEALNRFRAALESAPGDAVAQLLERYPDEWLIALAYLDASRALRLLAWLLRTAPNAGQAVEELLHRVGERDKGTGAILADRLRALQWRRIFAPHRMRFIIEALAKRGERERDGNPLPSGIGMDSPSRTLAELTIVSN